MQPTSHRHPAGDIYYRRQEVTESPQTDSRESSVESPQKNRFRVFVSKLERKGNRAIQKECEERFKRTGNPQEKIKWEKARREEIESCFQVAKDERDQAKNDAAAKEEEIKSLKRKLDETEKAKASACKDVHILLDKYNASKKARLDGEAAKAELSRKLTEQEEKSQKELKNREATYQKEKEAAQAVFQKTFRDAEAKYKIEIMALQEMLSEERRSHDVLREEHSTLVVQWSAFGEYYNQLLGCKSNLEQKLQERDGENIQLRQELSRVQEALKQTEAAGEEKGREIQRLNFAIVARERAINDIETTIKNYRQGAVAQGCHSA